MWSSKGTTDDTGRLQADGRGLVGQGLGQVGWDSWSTYSCIPGVSYLIERGHQ